MTRAEIVRSHSDEISLYPDVDLVYSYKVAGEIFIGTYKRGFWFSESAKAFGERLLTDGSLLIRYRSKAPEESSVHRGDQSVAVG